MRRFISGIIQTFRQKMKLENKKTNYWLEKLFNQEKDKKKENSSEFENAQVLEEKGREDEVKIHAGKEEKNRQAVEDMVSNSNRILLKISSVFPWDLFPSSLIAEETRLTIIHRQLFSSQIHSVDIKNISNVFIDNALIFAQLTIVSNTFAENQIVINRLRKKEAIFMRRIIEGLRMFVNKDIDTTNYQIEELIQKLKQLSTTNIL